MNKPLLQKNTIYLITWLPFVLIFCSILFYALLILQARHMQEKQLLLKQYNVQKSLNESSGEMILHMPGEYDIFQSNSNFRFQENHPKDTSIYYPELSKNLPFEMITKSISWKGKNYFLTTYVSSTEISHLIIKVFIAEAFILLLLMLTIVFLNRKSAKKIWKPFFSTIQQISSYDITHNQKLSLNTQTGITEFNLLNHEVNQLLESSNKAYNIQKQFVENASHEMQTPLAIIRSKLELMINEPALTEKNASLLQDITEANDRLSQMNRTLLLLAKIENKQFPEKQPINISSTLSEMLANLPYYQKEIPAINASVESDIIVQANQSLIEILLSNLINNAIIHNIKNGSINISLDASQLIVSNTGQTLQHNPETLFERFKKDSHHSKSTGLGLALVKQICILYGFTTKYEYNTGWHNVHIIFA